jgi:hypothetical protein
MLSALSDEKSGLYFSVFAGHRQHSLPQIWVPWDSWAYFIVSIFETPPTWRARFLYLFPPGTGKLSYVPRHWVNIIAKVKVKVILRPTVSRPVRLGIRHSSGTRDQFFLFSLWLFFLQVRTKSKSSHIMTDSHSANPSWCQAPRPATNFSFSLSFSLDSCGFVIL